MNPECRCGHESAQHGFGADRGEVVQFCNGRYELLDQLDGSTLLVDLPCACQRFRPKPWV